MSSKFFTWTKGDRRNASEALRSGGVIPIPVECISIKGLDYSRTTKASGGSYKARRRPIPLRLDSGSDANVDYNGRTDHSVALHDAAVQSATSLMAVMNDMLRSPGMSAHLQQRSGDLQPMHGRPRSHTAPSTPMAEVPVPGPIELPGSMSIEQRSSPCLRQSSDTKGTTPLIQPPNDEVGRSIDRPHTSPQGSPYPPLRRPRHSTGNAPGPGLFPPSLLTARETSPISHRSAAKSLDQDHAGGEEDNLVADSESQSSSMLKRPSLSVLQPRPSNMQEECSSYCSTQIATVPSPGPVRSPAAKEIVHHQHLPPVLDAEAALIEQISLMRASHSAHLAALKEAHEREVASQKAYITFLERRRGFATPNTDLLPAPKRQLTLDTSHAPGKHGEPLTSDASATTIHSFESSVDSQKRASQDSKTETESLKRKLSLARRSQSETGEIRRERDQLRDSVERSDRRIVQLKDIIRKAKDQEKALRNSNEDFRTKLETANNERLDVREGYYEACQQVKDLTERERALMKKCDALRGRTTYTNPSSTSLLSTQSNQTHKHGKHKRAKSDMSLNVWNDDPLLAQLRRPQQDASENDAKIRDLLQENRRSREDNARLSKTVREVQAATEKQQQALAAAESDRDNYNSLLHNELRRQTRDSAQKALTTVSQSDAEVIATAADMLGLPSDALASAFEFLRDPGAGADSPAQLKKQLEHCIKEIIMYKLDVQGYKKDLKHANAELETLRNANPQFPPTPDRDSTSSFASPSSSKQRRPSSSMLGKKQSHHGLGISSLQPPKTPTRTPGSIQSETLNQTHPPKPVSKYSPSPHRPKTPLSAHKKLPPKPPSASRTPSPAPAGFSTQFQSLQQKETPRSLSESIISSYGKRGTPEQISLDTPRRAGRRSEPVRIGGGLGHMSPLSRGWRELSGNMV